MIKARVRCPVCEREIETLTIAQVVEALGIKKKGEKK